MKIVGVDNTVLYRQNNMCLKNTSVIFANEKSNQNACGGILYMLRKNYIIT